ncbi:MAG TPA: restriction endonuclease subunit S [Lacipirellulaceae bacterium]|nr:restriction endonuclease subunit S [Lacipirellulaceae bacterium]
MIDGLEAYASFKDCGMSWAEKLPRHWKVERAKWLFRKMARPTQVSDDVVTCFRDGTVTLRKNRRVRGFTESIKEIGYQGVRKGDLVIHAMDGFAGAIGVSDADGKCSPVYAVCKPVKDVNPFFYAHVVREMARTQWITALAKGIRERSTDFRFDTFAAQLVPVPQKSEQDAIARFLDHAERRIRRYIKAKRRLIALLNEQKQAIIHRAVTRGLDPNVRLKPSGVEWLGDVPEHWQPVRLGRLVQVRTGFAFKSDGFSQSENDVRLLRGINVSTGRIRWDLVVRWPHADSQQLGAFKLAVGDIVLGMDRPIVSGGTRVAMLTKDDVPSLLLQRVACLRPRKNLDKSFLLLLLQSQRFADYLTPLFTGISVPHISPEQIEGFYFACPSRSQQQYIVDKAHAETAGVDALIGRCESEIGLLRAFAARLIADVVTGKLDVREAAAGLPDHADDHDPPDDADVLAESNEQADDADLEAMPEEVEA